MHVTEATTPGSHTRVQELCRQLVQLISRSRQQRRAIDRLLAELRLVALRVERRAYMHASGDERAETAPASSALPR